MTATAHGAGFLRSLLRLIWYVLAIGIVLMAVGLSALRIAVAVAPEYRAHLETRISRALGQPLTLGGLQVVWRGMTPRLILEDVRAGAEDLDGVGLVFRELRVDIDLMASIRQRTLTPVGVELAGMDLTVQRDLAGRFRVIGVGVVGQRESALEAMNELLEELAARNLDLHLDDSRVRLLDLRRQHSRELSQVELLLRSLPDGSRHLAGRAELPGAWGRDLAFALEWRRSEAEGPVADERLDVFLEARGVRPGALDELLGDAVAHGPALPFSGAGNFRLWGTLRGDPRALLSEHGRRGRHSGTFALRAGEGAFGLTRLFRDAIPFDYLAADANLKVDDEGWRLDVEESVLHNEDGRAQARFTLARRDREPVFLDLRAHVDGQPGNMANTSRYLPAGILREKLLNWLDNSIIDGTATNAEIVFFGHLPDFPFTDASGRFEVRADATDATLRFLPDWPSLTALDGRLRFTGRSMRITSESGSIGGARILGAEAEIPRLGTTALTIDGRLLGSGDAMLGFLRDMPVTGEGLDRILSGMRLDGEHGLSLALRLPFRGRPVEVDGRVELREAAFRVPAWGLAVDDLTGSVDFDRRGVTASGVEGRFHGASVLLSAETRDRSESETRIRVRANGADVPLSALHQHVPRTDFLTGAGDVQVTADLPGFRGYTPASPPVTLQFETDLVGVGNSMPTPLGKGTDTSLPLSVAFQVRDGLGPIRIRYGERASVLLALADGGGLERLGVRFGHEEAILPPRPGMELTGRVPELDLGGWLAWSNARSREEAAARDAPELHWVDLYIDTLRLGRMDLPDVAVTGRREDGWDLVVDGPTVAGMMRFPPEADVGGVVDINLRHLHLAAVPWLEGDSEDTETADALPVGTEAAEAIHLPPVRVHIGRLELLNRNLGRLDMRGERDEAGDYQLRELKLAGEAHDLEASGRWRVPEGSDIRFSMRTENMGQLLSVWGYPGAVSGGRGRLRGMLTWPGGPGELSPDRLGGEINLDLRNGRLVQVEPGAGRLLGLVSVAMLPRRLILNFSDVFEEGFEFDRLAADIELADGIARPRTLYVDGPAARISATGEVDLASREYDQIVTVSPKASATLPLIGGLIGGPPAAAAMFVAQQLFSGGVDGVARIRYRLTGPWDDPRIERMDRARAADTTSGEPQGSPTGP